MTNRTKQIKSDLLTPAKAAALCGLAPGTLAKMANEDRLSAIKPSGSHRRYLRSEIEALARFQPVSKR